MTLREIASGIELTAYGGKPSDDVWSVNFDWIVQRVNIARADIIGKFSRVTVGAIPSQFYQRICCLDVLCETIGCDDKSSGITRHYIKLPATLMGTMGNIAIRYLGSGSGEEADLNFEVRMVNKLDVHRAALFVANRKSPFAVLTGPDELELRNIPPQFTNIKKLCIEALFDVPVDTQGLMCLDVQYPVPGDILEDITNKVYFSINAMKSVRQDKHNDSGNL